MTNTFWKCIELDIATKKIIYHSLVESHLNYGIVMWCSEYARNLNTDADYDRIPVNLKHMNTVQNKIIRSIFRKPRYNKETKSHTKMLPLYSQLNVLKIQELYYYNLGMLAYDYFNSPTFPDLLKEKFDKFRVDSTHATRSQGMNLNYTIPDSFKTYRNPCIAS